MIVAIVAGPRVAWAQSEQKSVGISRAWAYGTTLLAGGGGGGLLAQGIASDDSVAEGLGKVLAGAGLSVGPSAGHFYAEEYEHAFLMSMGRVLFLAWTLGTLDGAIEDRRAPNSGEGSVALMGGIGWAALALYDLLDADDAARRYSEGPPTGYEMELRAGFMPLAGRGRLGVGFWVAY